MTMSALPLRSGQDRLVLGDQPLEFGGLVDDLLTLQRRQSAQLEVEDRAGLQLVNLQQGDQPVRGLVDSRRAADQGDDLVERIQRLQVAAQDVRVVLGLAQPERGPADDDVDLVVDPVR